MKKVIVSLFLIFVFAGHVFAADNYFQPAGGSGNWNVAANWSLGQVPDYYTNSDNAKITNGYICDVNSSVPYCTKLDVGNFGDATLNLYPGADLYPIYGVMFGYASGEAHVNMYGGSFADYGIPEDNVGWTGWGWNGDFNWYQQGGNAIFFTNHGFGPVDCEIVGGSLRLAYLPTNNDTEDYWNFYVSGSGVLVMDAVGGLQTFTIGQGGMIKIHQDHWSEFTSRVAYLGDYVITTEGSYKVAHVLRESYYVATDGNDNFPGTEALPYRTIAKARDAIRQSAGLPTGGVTVYLSGGVYYLDEPIVFNGDDSGESGKPIIYTNYPGETPVINGGREITGWTYVGDDKYFTTLPEVASGSWWFRQLWSDGQRCQRARWPNPGSLLSIIDFSGDFKSIKLNQSVPGSNLAANDAELVLYNYWSIGRAKIESNSGSWVNTTVPLGCIGHYATQPGLNDKAHVEHCINYIDQPFEWHLSRSTGVLAILMPSGVSPSSSTFIAPKLEKLIRFTGTQSNPVHDITFKGISIKCSGWELPSIGYGGIQAGHYSPTWAAAGIQYVLNPAIEFSYAQNCALESCYIANIATTGVGIGPGCDDNQIVDCWMYDIGGNGIMTGWRGDPATGNIFGGAGNLDTDWLNPSDAPQRNIISNNYLNKIGTEWFDCVGIFDAFCKFTEISNNIIEDSPYSGISVGFKWHQTAYSQQGTLVEQNHVYNVMNTINDGGGIYTLGNHQGGLLSGNLLHDIQIGWYLPRQNNGIFFDQGTTSLHCENTITYNVFGGYDYVFNNVGTITFGTNYWDDSSWGPAELAIVNAAGVEPNVPELSMKISENCDGIIVTGSAESWALIENAKILQDDYDVTSLLTIEENGAIHGLIPMSPNSITLQMVVSDPDGHLSAPGVSNTITFTEGDITCDGKVNFHDILRLSENWLENNFIEGQPCLSFPVGDLNKDCKVSFTDYSIISLNWLTY